MKVLLINGSPHEHGCTYTALSEVESALLNDGINTTIFHIGKGEEGCIGCGGCAMSNHRCVFGGKVNEALGLMEQADGLIIGSPVYFASPNGSLLSFLDRMFFAGSSYMTNKPAAAVVSARRGGTTASLDVLNKYFTIRNMPIVSSQYWNMVHGNTPEEVKQDLEGLQTMRTLGHNMAWLLKSIEAGKQAGLLPPEREQPVKTSFIR